MTLKAWAGILTLAACTAAPASAGVTVEGQFRIEHAGAHIGPNRAWDTAVKTWMRDNNVHAAQLAVRSQGALIFSHAYTMGAANDLVTTTKVFRLASVSKMLATAAITQLMAQSKLTGNEAVYPYLGIKTPLLPSQTADPRSSQITVLDLVNHTSGLPGDGTGDPLFTMRNVEVALGTEPLSQFQFARYLYGVQLNSDPGTTSTYSNVGYFLLAPIVQRAAGVPYATYVQQDVLQPLGIRNWFVVETSQSNIRPNEVLAEDPNNTGPSVFDLSANPVFEPFNFEGGNTIWELDAAPAGMMSNAESVSLLAHNYSAYGLGGRQSDLARSGCLPGEATWVESLNADIDFALLFSGGACLGTGSTVIQQLRSDLSPL
jgi:CubicO group peptidase (beta-lactamase class C family)